MLSSLAIFARALAQQAQAHTLPALVAMRESHNGD